MSSFVIIGAGECGARATFSLRERGFDGSVTLLGDETLLPYERPPLSKEAIVAGTEPKFVARATRFEEQNIRVLTGVSAVALDRTEKQLVLSDGSTLSYDKLLLSTGARARELPLTPSSEGRVRVLRSHSDALAIRSYLSEGSHVAIVGGGFIGLELAASARKLGARVTLLESLPRVLTRGVPTEIAEVLSARHRAEGVELLCGVKINAIKELAEEVRITLDDGDIISANILVVGIGCVPNTALAESAGLLIDNGIAVDERLRTLDPDIYAAGDCCSYPLPIYGGRRVRLESWRNAQEQGSLAAGNMFGGDEAVSAVPWFWSDQYDLTLQIAGLADGTQTTVRRAIGEGTFILFHLDGQGRLIAASGIGKGSAVARDIRLAEMLIATSAHPDPAALASPDIKLKTFLAA